MSPSPDKIDCSDQYQEKHVPAVSVVHENPM